MIPKTFIFKRGKHSYSIPLRHKINNIYGITAIGKTELVRVIASASRMSNIIKSETNIDPRKIRVNISYADLRDISNRREECLIVLDETNELLKALIKSKDKVQLKGFSQPLTHKDVIAYIRCSNAVYLFITRNTRSYYPLPQDAVLELKNSDDGFTHTAVPFFADNRFSFDDGTDNIVCEDSNSGYDFIDNYVKGDSQVLYSSFGIEKLPLELRKYNTPTSVFYDYLGAGHIVYDLPKIYEEHGSIVSWPSIEWHIIKCLSKVKGYEDILNSANYILNSNNIYNKEDAITLYLKKYIAYNKKFSSRFSNCTVYIDCDSSGDCRHDSDDHLSEKAKKCILYKKEQRYKVFKWRGYTEDGSEFLDNNDIDRETLNNITSITFGK